MTNRKKMILRGQRGKIVRVGTRNQVNNRENKIYNIKNGGNKAKWGKKKEKYAMWSKVQFKKYWTNGSKIGEKPQQGQQEQQLKEV